jgi:hypothetical protein
MKNSALRFPKMVEASLRQKSIFWAKVFENLAFGKAPQGCFITSSSFLVCKLKGSSFSYFLGGEKGVEEQIKDIVNIFTKKLNYMSIQDRMTKLNSFIEIKEKIKKKYLENKWGDFKKKKHKDQLVASYVIRLTKSGSGLSEKQLLQSIIYMGLIFKKLSPTDVNVENCEIKSIPSLCKHKSSWVLKDLQSQKKTMIRTLPKKKRTLSSMWVIKSAD